MTEELQPGLRQNESVLRTVSVLRDYVKLCLSEPAYQLGVVSDYVIAAANLQIGEFVHHTSNAICPFLPLYSAAALLYV